MVAAVTLLLFVLPVVLSVAVAWMPRFYGDRETLTLAEEAVEAVLSRDVPPHCSAILLTDGSTSAAALYQGMKEQQWAPWGMAMFEVRMNDQDANRTQAQLSRVIFEAKRLRQVSWCVTVVVVSDDPAFLATFAQWSLKGRLLVWSTRLLAVTRLPFQQLQDLHRVLSSRNAMLLIVEDTLGSLKCRMYLHLPFSPPGAEALWVATWTPLRGLALSTRLSLFPEKFTKFINAPNLLVSVIAMGIHNALLSVDPEAPEGQQLIHTGPIANVVEYLAESQNFTYTYVVPQDNTFGTKADDGSWNGMVGMVQRAEADISIGPVSITATRSEAVDFAWPMWYDSSTMLAGLGRPEVDPWGFLLPLAPLVWVAILTALVVGPAAVFLSSSCFSMKTSTWRSCLSNIFGFIRVLLQQDISVPSEWWWERVMLGVWMMMTLVLTRSYAGNLMSLLAVRHIPQPYQTLSDVIDDPSAVMIWQRNSINAEYLRVVKSGIIREVADLEDEGRLLYRTQQEYPRIVDTLVRRGQHVLFGIDVLLRNLMAKDFTRKGQCDFYTSRERHFPFSASIISQKDNPILPAMHNRMLALTGFGIFERWFKTSRSNSTKCLHPPKKITVNASLSLTNLWGMFVVLAGGSAAGLLTFCTEFLSFRMTQACSFSTKDQTTA